INSNSARLYEFDDLAEVQSVIEKLATAETPYLRQLERQPGQKEARYMHLFGDASILETYASDSVAGAPATTNSQWEERLSTVEQELATLREQFDKLMKELMG